MKGPLLLHAHLALTIAAFSPHSLPRSQSLPPLHAFHAPDNNKKHPHERIWSSLSTSPNSHVHPSISLKIRPPSNGGTGLFATSKIAASTTLLSLRLDEIPKMDAGILDSYQDFNATYGHDGDAVLNQLCNMWNNTFTPIQKKQDSEEGTRLAVLAGIVAHFQLCRYKDKTSWVAKDVKEDGFGVGESRRLGSFLDAMPLLPSVNLQDKSDSIQDANEEAAQHPFPTHFLFWTEEEVSNLLQGTMAQTKAREIRAGVGLILNEWSPSFLLEHSSLSPQLILNAIFSGFAAVTSRSFGDDMGRDVEGRGRMLVPIVDMLNHESENPNVLWRWYVDTTDDKQIRGGKGDIVVTSLRDIQEGEELCKEYGWRAGWDIASSYGFVPRLMKERWECSVLLLFPAVLDLNPKKIVSPVDMSKGDSKLDLTMETNYGLLVKAVLAAVDAANEIRLRLNLNEEEEMGEQEINDERPQQLNRIEVLSLFRSPPHETAQEYPFSRRQPVIVVGTKIDTTDDPSNRRYHAHSIKSILPTYRAVACAIDQLRNNHQNSVSKPIEASQMAKAAASLDKTIDWDTQALQLIQSAIEERMDTILINGREAEVWLEQMSCSREGEEERLARAGLARDVREAELRVLEALREEVLVWGK